MVDGGLEAIITCFSLISSIYASHGRLPSVDGRLPSVDGRLPSVDGRLSSVDGIVLGSANLMANRIFMFMFFGYIISVCTEKDMAREEREVDQFIIRNGR